MRFYDLNPCCDPETGGCSVTPIESAQGAWVRREDASRLIVEVGEQRERARQAECREARALEHRDEAEARADEAEARVVELKQELATAERCHDVAEARAEKAEAELSRIYGTDNTGWMAVQRMLDPECEFDELEDLCRGLDERMEKAEARAEKAKAVYSQALLDLCAVADALGCTAEEPHAIATLAARVVAERDKARAEVAQLRTAVGLALNAVSDYDGMGRDPFLAESLLRRALESRSND